MTKTDVIKDYVWSAFWIVAFLFVAASSQSISHIISFDFVHGNPNRTFENALFTMILRIFLFSIVGLVVFFNDVYAAAYIPGDMCMLVNQPKREKLSSRYIADASLYYNPHMVLL